MRKALAVLILAVICIGAINDRASAQEIEAVDMGLSVLWGDRNLGAKNASDKGNYYLWGRNTPVTLDDVKSIENRQDHSVPMDVNEFMNNENNLLPFTYTKYTPKDKKKYLDPEDDAASKTLGGNWRMPTRYEFLELINESSFDYTSLNGVMGVRLVSNKNGNEIFLPICGILSVDKDLTADGLGIYLSKGRSSADGDERMITTLMTTKVGLLVEDFLRDLACSIRPVLERVEEEDPVFQAVEDQPEFPGGTQALLNYLKLNIKYPEECRKRNVEGRVIVSFVVNKDGTIINPEIVKSVHPLLDQEAIRVISNMPKWKPGIQRGSPVRVKYTIPVNFNLSY